MKLTVKQLKGLIRESVAISLKEAASVEDVMMLTDKAHNALSALRDALEIVGTNRGYNGESDADSWERAAKKVAELAMELDSIDVLSKFEQGDEIDYNDNTNKWKRSPRGSR
jgi:hypothetical protein